MALMTTRQRRFTKLHESLNDLLTEFFAANPVRGQEPPAISTLLSWTKAQMTSTDPQIQKLLWIPRGIEHRSYATPQVPLVDYPWVEKPDRVWTLLLERDQSLPPNLPFFPTHHHNAFLEDEIHDWTMRQSGTKFHYGSRATSGGCWVLLLFREEPHAR